ncbi:MAG: hypothetical protein AMS27_17970 [Bacteroides sp. SM23_62_1]|nr:MAG: hypothetical protein AMS27_17970 [Bacteroides sp. SM23_62_1]
MGLSRLPVISITELSGLIMPDQIHNSFIGYLRGMVQGGLRISDIGYKTQFNRRILCGWLFA